MSSPIKFWSTEILNLTFIFRTNIENIVFGAVWRMNQLTFFAYIQNNVCVFLCCMPLNFVKCQCIKSKVCLFLNSLCCYIDRFSFFRTALDLQKSWEGSRKFTYTVTQFPLLLPSYTDVLHFLKLMSQY